MSESPEKPSWRPVLTATQLATAAGAELLALYQTVTEDGRLAEEPQ
jgi:hypothetical protein